MSNIVIKLEGPLQGWGAPGGTVDFRPVAPYPEKSGVVGLLSAGLGYSYGDPRIAILSEKLDVEFLNIVSDIGTLVEKTYFVKDTDTYNYDACGRQENQCLNDKGGHRVVKQFRANACYYMLITTDDEALMDEIKAAIVNPVYPMYLGKKCCKGAVTIVDDDEIQKKYRDVMRKALKGAIKIKHVIF